jgi:RNA polymerase sigma factor (sigma-70 family)
VSPESHDTDIHFVRRLIHRDGAAWQEMVDRFGGMVSASCRRALLRAGQAADEGAVADAVADIFRLLLEKDFHLLRRYRPGRPLAAYLRVIAWSKTLNASRGRRRGISLEEAEAEDSVSASVEAAERVTRLQVALATLPERDAQALRWFYEEGLSYAEIARRFGIGLSGIGMVLVRARERLKEALGVESP